MLAAGIVVLSAYVSLYWRSRFLVMTIPFLVYGMAVYYVNVVFIDIPKADIGKVFDPTLNIWENGALSLLITIYVAPIKDFVNLSGHRRVSPYIYPFLLTDPNFLVIFMAGCVYFFSGVPFMNRWNNYYLLRSGRIQWVTGQIIHIELTSTTVVLTLVALMPYVHRERGWWHIPQWW